MSCRRSAAIKNVCCVRSAAASASRPKRRSVLQTTWWWSLNICSSRSLPALADRLAAPSTASAGAKDIYEICTVAGHRSPKSIPDPEADAARHQRDFVKDFRPELKLVPQQWKSTGHSRRNFPRGGRVELDDERAAEQPPGASDTARIVGVCPAGVQATRRGQSTGAQPDADRPAPEPQRAGLEGRRVQAERRAPPGLLEIAALRASNAEADGGRPALPQVKASARPERDTW